MYVAAIVCTVDKGSQPSETGIRANRVLSSISGHVKFAIDKPNARAVVLFFSFLNSTPPC